MTRKRKKYALTNSGRKTNMKIALIGYGKMGKTIEKLAVEAGHKIVFKSTSSTADGDLSLADVAIEFSTPETAFQNIKKALDSGIPVVSGTTGWLDRYSEIEECCKNKNGSFLYASNFSIGVNLFFAINEFAGKLMSSYKDYIVSIDEIHHTAKKDAPSGTAISLAEDILKLSSKTEWVLNKEERNKISIFSHREEDVKGTHIITYSSTIDTIQLKHEAHSREGFAKGAILAAEWLKNKKGVFTMKDVLGI